MPYNTAPEGWWQSFVDALPARTAKLGIVRNDGSPLVVPVWIDRDGDQVVFMTGADTTKGRSILRDGRVSLCLDNEAPPFDFLTIIGTTSTSTDPDELLTWATRIAGRYMGDELAEQYGRRNAQPPEMLVQRHGDQDHRQGESGRLSVAASPPRLWRNMINRRGPAACATFGTQWSHLC